MEYRPRHAEEKLRRLAEHFKVVLVTGARQVGKTTLLRRVFPALKSVVFDPAIDRYDARRDPDLFLDNFPSPIILDEVQYAPELLAAIKRRVDENDRPGQYLLTGSQNLGVLRAVGESLAGRIGMLHLDGMTPHEIAGLGDRPGWLGAYLDAPEELPRRFKGTASPDASLTRTLWRGFLPGMLDKPDDVAPDFFSAYVATYVERDVRVLEDIRGASAFGRFLGLTAAHTAQEINASEYGRELEVTPATARRWLDLLTQSYQWLELPPYHGRAVKRLTGRRKGHLRDSGIACWLQRLSSPDALAASPLLGPLFETAAVNAIQRQFGTLATPPLAYHWRTGGGGEVDLVLERDGKLYPIEVKCRSYVARADTRGLRAFRDTYAGAKVMPGLILYAGGECRALDERTIALPWNARVE
jgi:predicted AAA+ superfamily ATPase